MSTKTASQLEKDNHETLVNAFVDFLQNATPNPSFLGGEKERLSHQAFDRALRDAITQARPIYHPADPENSRFSQYDAELLNSTFQSWSGHILSSPAYTEGKFNNLRFLGDENLLATFKSSKKLANLTAEVLRRLETDGTFMDTMFDLGNGAFVHYDGGFRKWFNPVWAESPDDCIKIINKISNSPEFAYAAPDFYPALGKGSLTNVAVDREYFALKSTFDHLDNADKIFKGKPFTPVGQVLAILKNLGALPNLSDLPESLCQYTSRYKDLLATQVTAVLDQYDMGGDRHAVIGAMFENRLEPAFYAGVSVSVLAGIIGATSFMNKDFTLAGFQQQTLSEKVLSNPMIEPALIQSIIKKGRAEGLFPDQELISAKVADELWKYSVIGNIVNPLGVMKTPEPTNKVDRGPAEFDR